MNFLSGKKTYALSGVLILCVVLRALGIEVPDEVFIALFGAIGITVRLGIKKAEK